MGGTLGHHHVLVPGRHDATLHIAPLDVQNERGHRLKEVADMRPRAFIIDPFQARGQRAACITSNGRFLERRRGGRVQGKARRVTSPRFGKRGASQHVGAGRT